MNPLFIWALVSSLLAVSISAPVQVSPGEDFSQHVDLSKSLTKKLLNDIPTVHHSCISIQGLSLEPSAEVKNLEYIMKALAIPSAPSLAPLSLTHTLKISLAQITKGLQLYQHLLQELNLKLKCSDKVSSLLADLRDLSAQVYKIQQVAQITPSEPQILSTSLSSRLTGDYEVQVATHHVLRQLQSFGQDVYRSLRNISLTKPQA